MQVNLNLGEVNQTLAALDFRANRLNSVFEGLKQDPQSKSRDEAIDAVVDALHSTNMARLAIADAAEWTEPELREAYGR